MTSATTPSSKGALDEREAGVLGLSSGGRDAKASGGAEDELENCLPAARRHAAADAC